MRRHHGLAIVVLFTISAHACAGAPVPGPTTAAESSVAVVAAPTTAASASAAPTATSPPGVDLRAIPEMAARARPAGMVSVPAGDFLMGCNGWKQCTPSDAPVHDAYVDASYVDTTEVTVAQYATCVGAGACDTAGLQQDDETYQMSGLRDRCNWHRGREQHPINCVSWHQAAAYCRWAGKTLPTAAQWEKAARGTTKSHFPWGKDVLPSCDLMVMNDRMESGMFHYDGCGTRYTWPVGSKSAGASPYGALDMLGNVMEWVADGFEGDFYAHTPRHNPVGPRDAALREIRGTGFVIDEDVTAPRVWVRRGEVPTFRSAALGFRCALPVSCNPSLSSEPRLAAHPAPPRGS